MNIVFVAFSCNPFNGSEDQVGWSIPLSVYSLDPRNTIIVITKDLGRQDIKKWLSDHPECKIDFRYIDFKPTIFTRHGLWDFAENAFHKRAISLIRELQKEMRIDVIHQVTPVNYRAIGKYWRVCKGNDTKFVCGPIGAVGMVPRPFWKYCGLKHLLIEMLMQLQFVIKTFLYKAFVIRKIDAPIFVNYESVRALFGDKNKEPIILPEIGVFSDRIGNRKDVASGKPFTILFVGRLAYRKGHLLLLEALEGLPLDIDYRLTIVGDGPEKKRIIRYLEQSPIKDKVELKGNLPYLDMGRVYESADLLAFTTFREATGTVIIEALSAGLPVLTINRFGAPILLNDDCAYLYDGKNNKQVLESLRSCLLDAMAKPESVLAKRNKAVEQARTLTHEKKAERLLNLYGSLCKNV